MSEYNHDEIEYAISRTGVRVDTNDVIAVLRFLSGPTHDQNDSAVIEGEEVNMDRVAMGGGYPTVLTGSPTSRGNELRNAMSEAQGEGMADRDDQTGSTSSPKGTGNETAKPGDKVNAAQSK